MNELQEGITLPVVLNSNGGGGSQAAHKLVQTTRADVGAGFLLQTGRDQLCLHSWPAASSLVSLVYSRPSNRQILTDSSPLASHTTIRPAQQQKQQ